MLGQNVCPTILFFKAELVDAFGLRPLAARRSGPELLVLLARMDTRVPCTSGSKAVAQTAGYERRAMACHLERDAPFCADGAGGRKHPALV